MSEKRDYKKVFDGSRIKPSTSDGANALCLVSRPLAWALKLLDSLRSRPNLSSANHRNGQIASYFQGVAAVIFKANRIRVPCLGVVSCAAIPFTRTSRANSLHNDQPDQRTLSLGWIRIVDVCFFLTVFRVFLIEGRNFTPSFPPSLKISILASSFFHRPTGEAPSAAPTPKGAVIANRSRSGYIMTVFLFRVVIAAVIFFLFAEQNLLSSQ